MTIESKIIKPIKIIVDDRETNSKTVQELKNLAGVEVLIQRLPLGDYEIDGTILFERKSLIDLAASIKDGRLFRQGIKLASSPIRCAVILEGTAQDLIDSKMRREAIQGALISLTVVLGIPPASIQRPAGNGTTDALHCQPNPINKDLLDCSASETPQGKTKIAASFFAGIAGSRF